jgi:hypothetical protein
VVVRTRGQMSATLDILQIDATKRCDVESRSDTGCRYDKLVPIIIANVEVII